MTMTLDFLKILFKRQGYRWIPWVFLLFSLPVTFYIWKQERSDIYQEQQLKFDSQVKDTANLITKQLSHHQQSLVGVQNFFRASNFISDAEFYDYVNILLAPEIRAGLHEIGFAKYVQMDNPETFGVLGMNEKDFLSHIYPAKLRNFYAPIVYIASGENAESPERFYDAFDHPEVMRSLFESARKNKVIVAKKIQIDPMDVNDCTCISMHLPIYKSIDLGVNKIYSLQDVYGWVFFNVDPRMLFENVLLPVDNKRAVWSVVDLLDHQKTQLVYQTSAPGLSERRSQFNSQYPIKAMDHEWRLTAKSLPLLESEVNYSHANQIGLLGLLTNLAVVGILYLLIIRMHALAELRNVNKRLVASEQRWKFALEGSGDGVWDWDYVANTVIFSKRWKSMLGYEEHELADDYEEWRKRIHPTDYPTVMKALEATLRDGKYLYSIEFRLRCKDDSWKWILARGMVVSRDEQGRAMRMVGTHTDISHLKDSEEAIWQYANFDALTGLPNRRMFYAKLEQEIHKAKRFGFKVALIFLDLDRFKEVNDSLGHDQGDLLLTTAATRLTQAIRDTDIVARLGGDEFVVLIGDIEEQPLHKIEIVCHKILNAIATPFDLSHQRAYISASLGVAVYPDDALDGDGLLRSVDQAMYASKARGGNCFTYFTPAMQENALNRMQLSNDLRSALVSNALFIEYQPIIELRTGAIHKAEALLRWYHPSRGLVGPMEFIPIAEDTRLINEIGNWVFQQAVKQVLLWREHLDAQFQITVNKSPVQFANEEPIETSWIDHLHHDAMLRDAIVVEITEGLLLDANDKVKDRLKLYQELGVQVALDDFGTGYSSLSYLKKFDIDYLKIDKSFVANLTQDSDDLVLCEAMIMMAHRLGMKVVAEGIETEQQCALLIEIGCDYGQGYYFSKPVSAEMFEQYVRNLYVKTSSSSRQA